MLWLQSGTSLGHAATGDLSDTVRCQNTALCSWNRSTAGPMQEAASRGCNILPAQSGLSQAGSIPGGRAADVLQSPIHQSPGRIICTLFPWANSCHSTRSFCWWRATHSKGVSGPGSSQRFSNLCCTETRKHHPGGREGTGIQPGSPCPYTSLRGEHLPQLHSWPTCLLNKHIAWRAKRFRLYFISNDPGGVDWCGPHKPCIAAFVMPEEHPTSAEPLQRSLLTASKLKNWIRHHLFKAVQN